jgi:magnesium-transporting ATPase (P-type)
MNPPHPLPSVGEMSDRTRHATPADDVAAQLEAGAEGLTAADARARLERFGPNRLPETSGPSALRLLLDQFRTPLIWALLAAGGASRSRSASSRTG